MENVKIWLFHELVIPLFFMMVSANTVSLNNDSNGLHSYNNNEAEYSQKSKLITVSSPTINSLFL